MTGFHTHLFVVAIINCPPHPTSFRANTVRPYIPTNNLGTVKTVPYMAL